MRNLILCTLLSLGLSNLPIKGDTYGDWVYTLTDGNAEITGYIGNNVNVQIPHDLGGIQVKAVAGKWDDQEGPSSIFRGNPTQVESITISEGLTRIMEYAFVGATTLKQVTIPSSVIFVGYEAFAGCASLESLTFPESVKFIASGAISRCHNLANLVMPSHLMAHLFLGTPLSQQAGDSIFGNDADTDSEGYDNFRPYVSKALMSALAGNLGKETSLISALASNSNFVTAVANNDAFVTAVANKIKATGGSYGIATQSGLSSAIEPLATKTELTSSLAQSRTDGINSVLSNPNLWTLYTTSQIQNMAVGDLVLTKDVGGTFTLNYDIEQSSDLQTWTPYQALSLPLNGLPTDKAFVRIKAKQ
jgi:hypothetical protein